MLRHAARLSSRSPLPRPRARPLSTIDMGDTSVSARFREPDPSKPRIVPAGAETTRIVAAPSTPSTRHMRTQVLAYSGGLDTSTQLAYLAHEKGYEVCAYIADLGQDDVKDKAAIEEIRDKAQASGAYSFECVDLRREFIRDYVYECIRANCLYEGRYLLGTSMARPCIAKKQVELAWREKAEYVSHGSTGKGNDQVRFELCYLGMDPNLKCVTLWREPEYLAKFEGRQDLLDYASSHNIPVSQTKKHSYSEDENIMHISYESGDLEDPAYPGVVTEYPGLVLKKKTQDLMDTPDEPCRLEIDFDNGAPIAVREHDASGAVTNATGEDPLALFAKLNELAGIHGVGRIDIVENRYVGMKSRGCYETPGGTVLSKRLTWTWRL